MTNCPLSVKYDEDCKYRFDSTCTLTNVPIEYFPDDAECKKEIENEYRQYVNRTIKTIKRDYRLSY